MHEKSMEFATDPPTPTPSTTTTLHGLQEYQMKVGSSGGGSGSGNGAGAGADEATRAVKYRKCMKNHAASMGGNALDGCGEFMPSGGEGMRDAHKCAACGCHRNFHRREEQQAEAEAQPRLTACANDQGASISAQLQAAALASASAHPAVSRATATATDDRTGSRLQRRVGRKRFRTKFSGDQKEKMVEFAEKVGWRIQRQDEEAVQEFCAEIAVQKHVLKVWMHNNRNLFSNKSPHDH